MRASRRRPTRQTIDAGHPQRVGALCGDNRLDTTPVRRRQFRTAEPEFRLYELLEATEGGLAHARYNALMRRVVSFADACRLARIGS